MLMVDFCATGTRWFLKISSCSAWIWCFFNLIFIYIFFHLGALGASGLVSNLSFSSQSVLLWLWSTSFGGVCSHFPWVGLVGTHGCVKVFTFFLHTLLIFCSHELLQLKGFSWLCYSMWFCFSFSVVFTVFLSLEFTLCLGGGVVRIGLLYVCFWFCFALY